MLAESSAIERSGRRHTPTQETHEFGLTKAKVPKMKKRCTGRGSRSTLAKKRCTGREEKMCAATAKVRTIKDKKVQGPMVHNSVGAGAQVTPTSTAPA